MALSDRHILQVVSRTLGKLLSLTKPLLQCACIAVLALSINATAQQPLEPVSAEREQGIKLYQAGDIQGALKALRVATRKSKEDGMAWHYFGLSLFRHGDLKDARKAFEKAVKLLPKFAPSHSAFAYLLLSTNRVEQAESEAQNALALETSNSQAHYIVGAVRLRKGYCSEAATHADAASVSAPEFAPAYLLKSEATLCEVAASTVNPFTFSGTIFQTSTGTEKVAEEDKRLKAKKNALRFRAAAESLNKFLELAPNATDAAMWREQLESLRIFAEPADKPENERTVFMSSDLTTWARVLAKPEPTYTEEARTALIEGTVVLRAVFAADGTVQHLLIMNSLPGGLTQQAIAVARKIKFIPATKDGRPVSMYIQLEYNFNLY
jgi:TonB family protein